MSAASSPLQGIRILDLTRLLPGGLCSMVLSDLGAEVVKVEAPPVGDYARAREPHRSSLDSTTTSITFAGLNRGKRSVTIDLKDPVGLADFIELVRSADVVLESFRPGVMNRLGIDHAVLASHNPGIITCSISGWGQSGPLAQAAGHDINYLAALGLLSFTGAPDEVPALSGMQIADSSGGLLATIAILAALRQRDQTGTGQSIDVSLAHSSLLMAAMTGSVALAGVPVPRREDGLWSGGVICYQTYRCADGWVAIGALEEKFWSTWCRAAGCPDLQDERYARTGSGAHARMIEIFAARDRESWRAFAAEHDCCVTVVDGLAEAFGSDLVRERGAISQAPHVDSDGTRAAISVLSLPVQFSAFGSDDSALGPAPGLGEDNSILLRSHLPQEEEGESHA